MTNFERRQTQALERIAAALEGVLEAIGGYDCKWTPDAVPDASEPAQKVDPATGGMDPKFILGGFAEGARHGYLHNEAPGKPLTREELEYLARQRREAMGN